MRRRPSLLHEAPAEFGSLIPRTGEAGEHPFTDHGPFKFCEDADHLEHRSARRRRGVEALLMWEQIDALGVQLAEQVKEVYQRSAQGVSEKGCRFIERPSFRTDRRFTVRNRRFYGAERLSDPDLHARRRQPPKERH
jgi:hypothetical protein